MIEMDPEDVTIGMGAGSMERRALELIARVWNDAYRTQMNGPTEYGLPRVCEHSTQPLPHGCWTYGDRSPYARYGAERWCDRCIAYAAMNGTLPRPELTIEATTSNTPARLANG